MGKRFLNLKQYVPLSAKRPVWNGMRVWRNATAPYLGVLPDFIMAGAQKCGTTSLFEYMAEHPSVYEPITKEIGYFDRYYNEKDIKWYRTQFPSVLTKNYVKYVRREPFVTGEASTGYILNPHSLRRIADLLPKVKIILLLRDPVDRAFSHYQHSVRDGLEPLSFTQALDREEERIGAKWKRTMEDGNFYDFEIALHAYLLTGVYVEQVKVLMNLFPMERVLILKNEDLLSDPTGILNTTLRFLDLPPMEMKEVVKHNAGKYSAMDQSIRQRLVNYYREYNRQLYELCGRDFGWQS
jgi:hypothetical protein